MSVAVVAVSLSRQHRGTKRLCIACDVPFYDLTRDPILCPACGGEHVPIVRPVVELRPVASSQLWRGRGQRPNSPVHTEAIEADGPKADADDVAAEDLEEAGEEASVATSDDDTVLESEADDADTSDLIEHDPDEQKDQ